MKQLVRVTQSYKAFYEDPVRVAAGTRVKLTGRVDVWDGHTWLWAIAKDSREGWIPDSLVEHTQPPEQVALFDYSAVELSCETGESLTRQHSTHGWSWCINAEGDMGWVPDRYLKED